ncbi:uncharacterized protein LOC130825374 isoform X3 [Amaranthus tricolor]|uniref:uncharacterized protein LOC130825374 isoform X3 n=1 Tax=Amaranthus tricolor TaxID=29722 RepID=UPI00258946E6|nr:uncharacterized protein LOC130825374 isoform X3 [Amaranthus tricolor]
MLWYIWLYIWLLRQKLLDQFDIDGMYPVERKHKKELEKECPRNIEQRHKEQFSKWIQSRVRKIHELKSCDENLYNLVCGPSRVVRRYTAYIVNGFRFHTNDRCENRDTQTSGIMVCGDDSSSKEYYGVLRDIFQVHYPGGNHVFVFKCNWFDIENYGRGYKVDEHGLISVNKNRCLKSDEVYVLESQVEQVFYIEDERNENWQFVIKAFAVAGDSMLKEIQDKFEVSESSDYLRMHMFILETMQRLYRLYKCRLHYYYKSKKCGNTDDERKKNPPPDLPQSQWEYLIKYYGSDEFKLISARNSKNRNSDKRVKHTTGQLSFPESEDVLVTKKNRGVKLSADKAWLIQHTRKNDDGKLE